MPRSADKMTELHQSLGERYAKLQGFLDRSDDELQRLAPSVSQWSVAKQMHHVAAATGLMLTGITRIARKASPAIEEGRINTIGRAVMMTGRLPRGKARAPARTMPPETVSRDLLTAAISRSKATFTSLPEVFEAAAQTGWKVEHPYFGPLDPYQWLKLAALHADHHFRIIEDIDSAA